MDVNYKKMDKDQIIVKLKDAIESSVGDGGGGGL
jgi:hypothetical protein